MQGSRPARVGELIKEALSERLIRRVKDPRVSSVSLLTVTRVEVSADLRHARVLCSVVGDPEQRRLAIRGLEHAAGFLRSGCARELRSKVVPELHFLLDEGTDHVARVEQVLRELEAERARDLGGEPEESTGTEGPARDEDAR